MKVHLILRSQSGFGLIEALIGVALVVILALLTAQFSSTPFTSKATADSRSCEALAKGTIDVIKKRGIYHDIYNYFPIGSNRRPPNNLFSHMPYMPDNELWSAQNGNGANEFRVNEVFANAYTNVDDDIEESRTGHALIDGSMRTLTGIYNHNPSYNCVRDPDGNWFYAFRHYAPLSHVNQGHVSDLVLPSPRAVMVRISPYRLSDGQPITVCPAVPPVMRPLPPPIPNRNVFENTEGVPSNENPGMDAFQFTNITRYNRLEEASNLPAPPPFASAVFPGDNATSDRDDNMGDSMGNHRGAQLMRRPGGNDITHIGYILTVEVSYLDRETGQQKVCNAQQRFQYHMDQTKPPQPTVRLSQNSVPAWDPDVPPGLPEPDGMNYAIAGASPDTNPRFLRVIVQYDGPERGIQLMCRDRSRRLTWKAYDHFDFLAGRPPGRGIPCVVYNPATPPYDPLDPNFSYPPSIQPANATGPPEAARQDLPTGVPTDAGVVREWVPCEQVRACGVTPTARLINNNPQALPNGYILDYRLNPTRIGCDVTVDAIAIDTAGNRSDLEADLNNSRLVRNQFSIANSPSSSVIRPPRCGRNPLTTTSYYARFGSTANLAGYETEFGFYCSDGAPNIGYWSGELSTGPATDPLDPSTRTWSTYYPNGYFTTSPNGCCVGPNCAPQICNGPDCASP